MRIAEICAVFPPVSGGTGVVCLQNALALAKRGHDVTVFTIDHGAAAPPSPGVAVAKLRTPLVIGRGAVVPQLCRSLRGFDAAHLHYPFFGGAEYVWLASVLRGLPYVVTYHNDVFGETGMQRVLIPLYERLFMRRILIRARTVCALSLPHLRSSKAAPFLDRLTVAELPNGVDTSLFAPRRKDEELIRRHALEGRTVMLFIGHLIPLKGLHLVIEALAALRDERLVLLVVGEGPAEERYRRMVREKGLERQVIFVGGSIPHDEVLPRYFNTADMLVLPSTESEAFPLVVIEAMSSGLPVVVSSLPGPSAIVSHGRDGLVAAVNDVASLIEQVRLLAENAALRTAMGAAGREKALARYDLEASGALLERLLRDAAGPRQS